MGETTQWHLRAPVASNPIVFFGEAVDLKDVLILCVLQVCSLYCYRARYHNRRHQGWHRHSRAVR